MAKKESLKLNKQIISNIFADKIHGLSFNKLANPTVHLDDSKIQSIYTDTFYSIPKSGKNSHRAIINQSYEHLNPAQAQQQEDKIEVLVTEIESQQQKLFLANSPPPSNPLYPNGTMLTAGENGIQFSGMSTIWVMDRGVKRSFANNSLYREARAALGITGDDFSELHYLPLPELNVIPDGLKITSGADFSTPIELLSVNYAGIYFQREFTTLVLRCEGHEMPDTYNLITGDYYVTNGFCVVKYIEDQYYGDNKSFEIITRRINSTETATIKILKHKGLPSHFDNDSAYDEFYNYGPVTTTPPNWWGDEVGNPQTNTLNSSQPGRKWGKDREYKGIVFANGRIDILKIDGNTVQGDTQWFLNAKDTTQHIPSSISFEQIFGIDGNRRINNVCQQLTGEIYEHCYGSLNQSSLSTINMFNDTTSNYYHSKVSMGDAGAVTGDSGYGGDWNAGNIYGLSGGDKISGGIYSFYGQPILRGRYDHDYIILDIDKTTEQVWFFDLTDNVPVVLSLIEATQKFMMVKAGITTPNNDNILDWEELYNPNFNNPVFKYHNINSSRINYIGLVGTVDENGSLEDPIYLNATGGVTNYWNDFNAAHGQTSGDNYLLHPTSLAKLNANNQPEHTTGCDKHLAELLNEHSQYGILPEGCHYGNCKDC